MVVVSQSLLNLNEITTTTANIATINNNKDIFINELINMKPNVKIATKSHLKTIKIFVASNKNGNLNLKFKI